MEVSDVKNILKKHNIPMWKLAKKLKISRSTLNGWQHYNYADHEDQVSNGIHSLIHE